MRHFTLLLFTALLFPLTATAASDQIKRESFTSQNVKRTYYLFAPSTAKTSAPLIVLLHGSGRNGFSLVEKWKDLAAKEGVVLAGPNAQDSAQWFVPQDGPDFLRDFVEHIKSKYSINPRKVYLFGHSAGAVFALYISLIESEYFAATAIHAGAFNAQGNGPIDLAKRKVPFAVWVGTNHPFFR